MLPMDQPPPRTRERRPPEKGLNLVIFGNHDDSSSSMGVALLPDGAFWTFTRAALLPDGAFWTFTRAALLPDSTFGALLPTDGCTPFILLDHMFMCDEKRKMPS